MIKLDTSKGSKKMTRFIILIPHRDALKSLEEYRQRLFSIGVSGAHSFPPAAPIAHVSRPFSREELKGLARNIRELTGGNEGKILSAGTAIVHCPYNMKYFSFFGPVLSLSSNEGLFPEAARNKLLHIFLPPVLCAAIVGSDVNSAGANPLSEEAPSISFRAASLANLAIRPLKEGDYSFEWKIGPPVWLPKHKGKFGRISRKGAEDRQERKEKKE